jgi:spoIIIJ-associated protein
VEARNEGRRSVVASGKTVDVAIANGLTMLGVRRDEVDVEILSEGSRGVLGFGAEDARVRLMVKLPQQWEPDPPPPEPDPIETSDRQEGAQEEIDEDEGDLQEPEPEQVGRQVLTEILRLMGIEASVESHLGEELAEEGEAPPPVLNITGDDLGILIGRRGETLRALQYLVRLMVSHQVKHWTNLVVDVENYRVRRRRTLENLANRVAEDVARSGRSRALEPMTAYDRRLVHIALRKNPDVATQSVGDGEKRRVTIVPK